MPSERAERGGISGALRRPNGGLLWKFLLSFYRRLCSADQRHHWEGLGEESSVVWSEGQTGLLWGVAPSFFQRHRNGKMRASLDAEWQDIPIVPTLGRSVSMSRGAEARCSLGRGRRSEKGSPSCGNLRFPSSCWLSSSWLGGGRGPSLNPPWIT